KNSGGGFTNIPAATTNSLTIANATLADAASYRCVASNVFAGTATSQVATVTVSLPGTNYALATIWSAAVGSQPWLKFDSNGSTPLQRSLGYSALNNQLYVISRTAASAGLTVSVLDPATGVELYKLNTNGIAVSTDPPRTTDNIILSMLAVA